MFRYPDLKAKKIALSLQLVTCVPTEKLPHMFSWGASTPQEIEMLDAVQDEPDSMEALPDDMGRRGQILWIRGLTRLQHQVGNLRYLLKALPLSISSQCTYKTHRFIQLVTLCVEIRT